MEETLLELVKVGVGCGICFIIMTLLVGISIFLKTVCEVSDKTNKQLIKETIKEVNKKNER